MKDIQKTKPAHEIDINLVGVKNLKAPIVVIDKKNKYQETVGSINIFVNLPRHHKGTHMSRFIEILNKYTKKTLTVGVLDKLTLEILRILKAKESRIEIEFPYFILKSAPISKKKSLLDYQCKIIRIADRSIKDVEHIIQVEVPITTVCPCSKAISKHGAHNQRGYVTASIKFNKFIWIEEIIDIIEKEASCEIYPLLKREDEKYVTERAYKNPKFVEDIVRDISHKLKQDKRIDWFEVECENQESVHNHNVYAKIENGLLD